MYGDGGVLAEAEAAQASWNEEGGEEGRKVESTVLETAREVLLATRRTRSEVAEALQAEVRRCAVGGGGRGWG